MKDLGSAVVLVVSVMIPLVILIATLAVAYKGDIEAKPGKVSWLLGILMLLMFVGGVLFGSHPALYPSLARLWANYVSLNANDIDPIPAPKRGTDFELADHTVTFKNRPADTLWVVKIVGEKPFLVPRTDTTYTIPEKTNPNDVEVYWQSRIDGRTSSPIGLTN